MGFFLNPHYRSAPAQVVAALDGSAAESAAALLAQCFVYQPTRLVSLRAAAAQCGVGAIHIKDEGARLGLTSFKALGGAYAVVRLLLRQASRQLGRAVHPGELPRPSSGTLAPPEPGCPDAAGDPDVARIAAAMVFACATDGNHGQSVAAGARLVGARAIIFVHGAVSAQRIAAIARFGAEIRVVPGSYDDAVAESAHQSAAHGWTLLSDTSWPGYLDVPTLVMQGYTVMVHELARQLPAPPTHVFLQAGVGGFAAAVANCLHSVVSPGPRVVVVEPQPAACLLASARSGARVRIADGAPTLMAMLECYEPSLVAWDILRPLASGFLDIDDAAAIAAMRVLANPVLDSEVVLSGESGSAGLAGLLTACADPALRSALLLDADSRVLLVNTESATDTARYAAAVGQQAAQVSRRAAAGGGSAAGR